MGEDRTENQEPQGEDAYLETLRQRVRKDQFQERLRGVQVRSLRAEGDIDSYHCQVVGRAASRLAEEIYLYVSHAPAGAGSEKEGESWA